MYKRKASRPPLYAPAGYKRPRYASIPSRTTTTVVRTAARRKFNRTRYYKQRNLATLGFLGIERKFYDTFLADTALTNETGCANGEKDPSATSMITTPSQGDGEQQRDGKQISCLYIEICGSINFMGQESATAPIVDRGAFLAIVLDSQSNGAQMNSEDCFKNTSADATLGIDIYRNLLFGKRFKILKQQKFQVPPTISSYAANTIDTSGHTFHFRYFIPLNGLRINFNSGTTSSIANVVDNSIHVIAFKTETAETVNIGYNARLRFVG